MKFICFRQAFLSVHFTYRKLCPGLSKSMYFKDLLEKLPREDSKGYPFLRRLTFVEFGKAYAFKSGNGVQSN